MALFFESLLLDLGILLLGLLTVCYVYLSRNYNFWAKKGVPFVKPSPIVGNFMDIVLLRKQIGNFWKDIYLQHKDKPCVGVFAFDQPMLMVRDLNLVKSVLVKDFNIFMDRNAQTSEELDPLSYKNLFVLNGQRWRHLRAKLSPTFTSGKMKRMFQLVDECGKQLVTYLENKSENGELEVKDAMARYTTDVIATCAFGLDGDALSNENSVFRAMLKRVFQANFIKNILVALTFFAPSLLTVLKMRVIDEDIAQFMRKTIWSTVEYREKNNVVRNDFLDLLMQIRKKGHVDDDTENGSVDESSDKLVLDGDDFVAQSFIFLTAGFETSSTTMTFTLYELSLQPDIQKKLRDEIQSVLKKNDGKVTYDGVQEMVYLDMVVSETLRKYPVLPFLDRKALQPYTLPGSTIRLDKGQAVIIPVMGIHYDPQYYPEPERYDPERFSEENKRLRPNYTYLPFGEGPRICIGMRMGLMQTKVGLVHLLSRFEVSPVKNTPIPMQLDRKSFTLTAKGGLHLGFKRIM
ncbi:cytochrome P450 6k1 [Anabrus simplex]|uniref:cytochrome P450 6k1 n=1 Tax=Anabrus simplex TaxID=316456 RepID=UPI0035A33B45